MLSGGDYPDIYRERKRLGANLVARCSRRSMAIWRKPFQFHPQHRKTGYHGLMDGLRDGAATGSGTASSN